MSGRSSSGWKTILQKCGKKNARIAHEEWDSTPIATSRLFGELNRIVDDSAYLCNELITSDAYPRKYLDFDHTRPPETRRREFYTTGGILGWGVCGSHRHEDR